VISGAAWKFAATETTELVACGRKMHLRTPV
jgi:hypothetical protein